MRFACRRRNQDLSSEVAVPINSVQTTIRHNGLKERHLTLMALGGSIGAGFFLGTGKGMHELGTKFLMLYLLGAWIVSIVLCGLVEMTLSSNGEPASFSGFASRYIHPLAGFISGWSYWLVALLVAIAEASAAGILLHGLFPSISQATFAMGIVLILSATNLAGTAFFGEAEFWLAMIKVAAMVAFVLFATWLLVSHAGSVGRGASITHLWSSEQPTTTIGGMTQSFSVVIFSFGGMEMIGLAAGRLANPEKALPRVLSSIFVRILFLYVGTLGLLLAIIPWREIDPHQSPFVQLLLRAGMGSAAVVVLVVAISALISSCNTNIFAATGMLQGLATNGIASAKFLPSNGSETSPAAVGLSFVILVTGTLGNVLAPTLIFNVIVSSASLLLALLWALIAITHLAYRKRTLPDERVSGIWVKGVPWVNYLVVGVAILTTYLSIRSKEARMAAWFSLGWIVMTAILFAGRSAVSQRERNA